MVAQKTDVVIAWRAICMTLIHPTLNAFFGHLFVVRDHSSPAALVVRLAIRFPTLDVSSIAIGEHQVRWNEDRFWALRVPDRHQLTAAGASRATEAVPATLTPDSASDGFGDVQQHRASWGSAAAMLYVPMRILIAWTPDCGLWLGDVRGGSFDILLIAFARGRKRWGGEGRCL